MTNLYTVTARVYFPEYGEIVERDFHSTSSNKALTKAVEWYNKTVGLMYSNTENFQFTLTINGLTYKPNKA